MTCRNSWPGGAPSSRADSKYSRGISRATGQSMAKANGKKRMTYIHKIGTGDGPCHKARPARSAPEEDPKRSSSPTTVSLRPKPTTGPGKAQAAARRVKQTHCSLRDSTASQQATKAKKAVRIPATAAVQRLLKTI